MGFSGCTAVDYGNCCFGVVVVAMVVWKTERDGGQFDMRVKREREREREREYGEEKESESEK